jgi:hypothetical protein
MPLFKLILIASMLAWVPPALAHVGLPQGRMPFLEDGELVGASTSWGIVLKEGDEWLRVCEEASGYTYFHHRAADGRVLSGTPLGLVVTDDGGCTHTTQSVPGEGIAVTGLAAVRDTPGRVFLTTAPNGAPGQVFESNDDGLTLNDVSGGGFADLLLFDVVASADGQLVVVSGLNTSTQAQDIRISENGGVGWREPNASLAGWVFVDLLGIDQGTLLFFGRNSDGNNHLLTSTDVLDTFVDEGEFDAQITSFAALGNKRFIVVNPDYLWVEDRDVAVGYTLVDEELKVPCLSNVPGDDRVWQCGQLGAEGHFFSSADGETWLPHLAFDAVVDRECPLGSLGEERCIFAGNPFGQDAGPTLDDDGGPGGTTPADAGPEAQSGREDAGQPDDTPPDCACGVSPSPRNLPWQGWGVFALLLGLFKKRRRGGAVRLKAHGGERWACWPCLGQDVGRPPRRHPKTPAPPCVVKGQTFMKTAC